MMPSIIKIILHNEYFTLAKVEAKFAVWIYSSRENVATWTLLEL